MIKRFRLRRAFTMIELLVVMAIIMILAGIALPALFAAKNQAYSADCTSNLNNLGKALTRYCTTLNVNLPAPDGFTAATVFTGSATNLRTLMADFGIETNSAAWFCKRHVKYSNLDTAKEMRDGRISYFYWGWALNTAGTGPQTIDMFATNSFWRTAGYSTNKPKANVLASDPFRDGLTGMGPAGSGTNDVQFHSGSSYDIPLSEAGSMVLLSGGAVQKLGPKQP